MIVNRDEYSINARSLKEADAIFDCLDRGKAERERRDAARRAHVYHPLNECCVRCERSKAEILSSRLECVS